MSTDAGWRGYPELGSVAQLCHCIELATQTVFTNFGRLGRDGVLTIDSSRQVGGGMIRLGAGL